MIFEVVFRFTSVSGRSSETGPIVVTADTPEKALEKAKALRPHILATLTAHRVTRKVVYDAYARLYRHADDQQPVIPTVLHFSDGSL